MVKREKQKTRGKGVLAKRLVRKQQQHEKVSGQRWWGGLCMSGYRMIVLHCTGG